MEKVLDYWRFTYYTAPLNLILALIALIIAIVKWKKQFIQNSLIYFYISYIMLLLVAFADAATKPKFDPPLRLAFTFIELITTIIELFVFHYVVIKFISSTKIQRRLKPIPYVFIFYIIVNFIWKNKNGIIDQAFLQNVFTVQAIFLIVACISYYVDLFVKEPNFKLLNEPSFWIVTGLSFFMICTFPFSILGQILMKANYKLYLQLFSIFNIFYCLLFIMIIRSYLCKPLTTR